MCQALLYEIGISSQNKTYKIPDFLELTFYVLAMD